MLREQHERVNRDSWGRLTTRVDEYMNGWLQTGRGNDGTERSMAARNKLEKRRGRDVGGSPGTETYAWVDV